MPDGHHLSFPGSRAAGKAIAKYLILPVIAGVISFFVSAAQTRDAMRLEQGNALRIVREEHANELSRLAVQRENEKDRWRDEARRAASIRASDKNIPLYKHLNDVLGAYVETLRLCNKSCLLDDRFIRDRRALQDSLSDVALLGSVNAASVAEEMERLLLVDPLDFTKVVVLQHETRDLIRQEIVECADGPACTDVLPQFGT